MIKARTVKISILYSAALYIGFQLAGLLLNIVGGMVSILTYCLTSQFIILYLLLIIGFVMITLLIFNLIFNRLFD